MKLDWTEFKYKWQRKILPNLGLVFAAFMMLMLALSGLGPLLRHYTPDEKTLNEEAAIKAEEFVKTTGSGQPQGNASLEDPHRGNEQVGEWLAKSVAQMLNFAPAGYEGHVAALAAYADERGRTEFHSFIVNSNILTTLNGNNYQLRGNAEGAALLLNKGAVDGRYRWLFEVPVLITFLPADAKSYKDTEHLSQHLLVTAQAGRIAYGVNDDELLVESFAVRKDPAYEVSKGE